MANDVIEFAVRLVYVGNAPLINLGIGQFAELDSYFRCVDLRLGKIESYAG